MCVCVCVQQDRQPSIWLKALDRACSDCPHAAAPSPPSRSMEGRRRSPQRRHSTRGSTHGLRSEHVSSAEPNFTQLCSYLTRAADKHGSKPRRGNDAEQVLVEICPVGQKFQQPSNYCWATGASSGREEETRQEENKETRDERGTKDSNQRRRIASNIQDLKQNLIWRVEQEEFNLLLH